MAAYLVDADEGVDGSHKIVGKGVSVGDDGGARAVALDLWYLTEDGEDGGGLVVDTVALDVDEMGGVVGVGETDARLVG